MLLTHLKSVAGFTQILPVTKNELFSNFPNFADFKGCHRYVNNMKELITLAGNVFKVKYKIADFPCFLS